MSLTASTIYRILYFTNIVKGERRDKTEKLRFFVLRFTEPNPIFYKYMKNFSHTEISYMKGRYYNFMTQLINV